MELQEELLNVWNTQTCRVLMITHDIGEALFLADRLVRMTNAPSASIGEILSIDFIRLRSREEIMKDSAVRRCATRRAIASTTTSLTTGDEKARGHPEPVG
ncbi:MAG: hypothetical protein RLZZ117_133 [Cyanobacteriota bacterium]